VAAFAELEARSNFSLLDGASHPEELVQTAQALGLAGLGICDLNSLAGMVRGYVAAKAAGLAFRVGCRLRLDDASDSEWLAWPDSHAAMLAAAEGWVLAAIPPERADAARAARLHRDVAALRDRLALLPGSREQVFFAPDV
jgi:error-prone DNA polymerase